MLKRFFTIAITLLTIAGMASAQSAAIGGWERYSSFSGDVSMMTDTPGHLYYVSNGYLFDYNKDDDTTTAPNSSTVMSDNNIDIITYNRDAGYLFVGYENGNIDLVKDNGEVINIPDIKDAAMNIDKRINSVWFEKDRTYVATTFGIVIIDGKKHYVIDSATYGQSVGGVFVTGNAMLIELSGKIMAIELGKSIRSLDNFTEVHSNPVKGLARVNDKLVAIYSGYDVGVFDYSDALTGKYSNKGRVSVSGAQPFITTADNRVYLVAGNNNVYTFDPETGTPSIVKTLPEHIAGSRIAFDRGLASVWSGNAKGVSNVDISADGVKVLSDYAIPANTSGVAEPMQLFVNNAGNHIYVTNRGTSNHRTPTGNSGRTIRQYVDLIENGSIRDVSGSGEKPFNQLSGATWQDGNGGYYYGNPQRISEDPDDETIYYHASATEGILKVQGNKILGQYSPLNSPMPNPWGTYTFDVKFDPDGNMWAFSHHGALGHTENSIIMLPAAKRHLDPTKVTAADWKIYPLTDLLSHDLVTLFCRHSNLIFIVDGGHEHGVYIIDTKGTYDNFADDRVYHLTNFVDQDGISTTPLYCFSLIEDKRGRVWIGTTSGVFEITDPSSIKSESITFNRIKVPRNDGSNYADYLLASDEVNWMSVDTSNRKWIATAASGLFLVSENGDRIIENFTADNSPLPTNEIAAVESDPLSNRVYVATPKGLLCYTSDSSPVADNYDNVYAYPNPVRPDYTGWITIAGLMDNSLVKIADAQGNVVFQTTSEGGMAVWDGCTSSGARVKTGVYYVFASSGGGIDGGSTTGAVTKILVVN